MKEILGKWGYDTDFYSILKNNIPVNDWNWYLFELVGTVNNLPHGVDSILEFEKKIMSSDRGLKYSWDSLLELSKLYDDVQDCILIASSVSVKYSDIQSNNFFNCYIYIYMEIFDSSSWKVIDFR